MDTRCGNCGARVVRTIRDLGNGDKSSIWGSINTRPRYNHLRSEVGWVLPSSRMSGWCRRTHLYPAKQETIPQHIFLTMLIGRTSSSFVLALVFLVSGVLSDELSTWNIRLDTTDTNYGPLTTVFTPPSSCFTPRTAVNFGYPSLIQGCKGPYGDPCCPRGWNYHAYFSPGRCPSGYRGCTLPTSTQRVETTNICCPK